MWITFAICIINLILNWFLIPNFGIKGAASATLFAHILGFITHVVVSQRYYRIPYEWISIITAMSLSVLLAVIGQSLRLGEVDHLIFKFILLGLLAVICYWTKLISKQEILFGLEQGKSLFRKNN
jgi:O-antigen/teichoic acid export membrane protein